MESGDVTRSDDNTMDKPDGNRADCDGAVLLAIGDVASLFGFAASAVRYYETRGLVSPVRRERGRRMYGLDELRRLALVKLFTSLGVPLEIVARVLDSPKHAWSNAVDDQMSTLDELIERAQEAKGFLMHARTCPQEHPGRDCRTLIGALDHLVEGGSVNDLGRRWGWRRAQQ